MLSRGLFALVSMAIFVAGSPVVLERGPTLGFTSPNTHTGTVAESRSVILSTSDDVNKYKRDVVVRNDAASPAVTATLKARQSVNDGSGFKARQSVNDGSGFKARQSVNDGSGFKTRQSVNDGSGFKTRQSVNDGSGFKTRQSVNDDSGFKRRQSVNDDSGFKARQSVNDGSGF